MIVDTFTREAQILEISTGTFLISLLRSRSMQLLGSVAAACGKISYSHGGPGRASVQTVWHA